MAAIDTRLAHQQAYSGIVLLRGLKVAFALIYSMDLRP
jgi:hypothetical protein